jgi:hypothetical protein
MLVGEVAVRNAAEKRADMVAALERARAICL